MMARRVAGRATRQILSGADLGPVPDTIGGHDPAKSRMSPTLAFFVALSVLVIAAAVIWALWGMAPATPIILLLAFALISAWIVL